MMETKKEEAVKSWEEMTLMERRVTLAKDVVSQIEQKRIVAKHDVLCSKIVLPEEANEESELSEIVRERSCNVCALGSLFIAKLDRYDQLKLKSIGSYLGGDRSVYIFSSDIFNYLSDVFSYAELQKIETVFESGNGLYCTSLKAANYFDTIYEPSAEERMLYIMQNIINNNGELNLDYKPWLKEETTTTVQAAETPDPSASS